MQPKHSFFVDKTKINMLQTLTCGQVFSYKIIEDGFMVYSADKVAKVIENQNDYEVITTDVEYFKNYFDLNTDYDEIKQQLTKNFEVMKKPVRFGNGIRILRQDLLETIISFAISANNRIPRIMKTLFYLREHFGTDLGDGNFAFPTLEQLEKLTEEDFASAGAGYRSPQLVKLVKQLSELGDITHWKTLETEQLKEKLMQLSGVGPKVADCILLFGYAKADVFPVDTWIEKMFNTFFEKCTDRKKIRSKLVDKFKDLSGYAQQYLFFYQRAQKI